MIGFILGVLVGFLVGYRFDDILDLISAGVDRIKGLF